eukprot:gene8720-1564_t
MLPSAATHMPDIITVHSQSQWAVVAEADLTCHRSPVASRSTLEENLALRCRDLQAELEK